MSSVYSGDGSGIAHGDSVDVTNPSDGDALNAASNNDAIETLADFMAFLIDNALLTNGNANVPDTANTIGLVLTGSGTAGGALFTGGATGGATAYGVKGVGAAGNSAGVIGEGHGSAAGGQFLGGGTNGTGVSGVGGATNGVGMWGDGTGTGAGVKGIGGGSGGSGGNFTGGSTGGTGVVGTGGGGGSNSIGVLGTGTGTGQGVSGTGGPTNGSSGVTGTSSATNGHGGSFTGTGTGSAVRATASTTLGKAMSVLKGGVHFDGSDADIYPASTDALNDQLTPLNFEKAWAYLTLNNTTTNRVQDGCNITSVTQEISGGFDGRLTVTFAQAMADTNYIVEAHCEDFGGYTPEISSKTTSGFKIRPYNMVSVGYPTALDTNGQHWSFSVKGRQ